MAKIAQKKPKTLNKTRENNKNLHSCEKFAHAAGALGASFSISGTTLCGKQVGIHWVALHCTRDIGLV